MSNSNPQATAGLTPAKIGLVGLLALVLVGVIAYQMTGSKNTVVLKKRSTGSESSGGGSSGDTTGIAANDQAKGGRRAQWEKIARSEVLLHDPFSLPLTLDPWRQQTEQAGAESPQTTISEKSLQQRRQATLDALREQGVSMVLSGPNGTIATIGSRQVRVGDVFDGLRVVEITPQGIVLAEEDTP